jgi:hypothetical protein
MQLRKLAKEYIENKKFLTFASHPLGTCIQKLDEDNQTKVNNPFTWDKV